LAEVGTASRPPAGSEGFGVQFSDYLPMIFALIAAFAVVVGVVVMIRRRNEP
jgi:hypothetical protein